MMKCILSRPAVAPFVDDILEHLKLDCLSITITKLEKSEGYCVSIVTGMLSAGIAEKVGRSYLKVLSTTSLENTQAG